MCNSGSIVGHKTEINTLSLKYEEISLTAVFEKCHMCFNFFYYYYYPPLIASSRK